MTISIYNEDMRNKETTMNNNDKTLAKEYFSTAPKGTKEAMVKTIKRSLLKGHISLFATIKNKAKLSAYRVVAKEMNITIGQWLIRSTSGTANAVINN